MYAVHICVSRYVPKRSNAPSRQPSLFLDESLLADPSGCVLHSPPFPTRLADGLDRMLHLVSDVLQWTPMNCTMGH